MNFEKRNLKVKIFGNEYLLNFPTVKQVRELSKLQETNKDGIETTVNFLSELGLPSEVCWEMEVDQLMELSTMLMGSKKK